MKEDWAEPLEDLGKGKEAAMEMRLEGELGTSMEVDPDPLKARNMPMSLRRVKPSTTKKAATTTSMTLKGKAKVEVNKPLTTTTTWDKGKAKGCHKRRWL